MKYNYSETEIGLFDEEEYLESEIKRMKEDIRVSVLLGCVLGFFSAFFFPTLWRLWAEYRQDDYILLVVIPAMGILSMVTGIGCGVLLHRVCDLVLGLRDTKKKLSHNQSLQVACRLRGGTLPDHD